MQKSRLDRRWLILSCWLLLLAAPVSGYFLLDLWREARAAERWPTVTGTVTKAEVDPGRAERFYPDVEYAYQVNGQEYTGRRLRVRAGEFKRKSSAEAALGGFVVGQQVPVFYNPVDPAQSVLRPGRAVVETIMLFIPVVLLVLALARFRAIRHVEERDTTQSNPALE